MNRIVISLLLISGIIFNYIALYNYLLCFYTFPKFIAISFPAILQIILLYTYKKPKDDYIAILGSISIIIAGILNFYFLFQAITKFNLSYHITSEFLNVIISSLIFIPNLIMSYYLNKRN